MHYAVYNIAHLSGSRIFYVHYSTALHSTALHSTQRTFLSLILINILLFFKP